MRLKAMVCFALAAELSAFFLLAKAPVPSTTEKSVAFNLAADQPGTLTFLGADTVELFTKERERRRLLGGEI